MSRTETPCMWCQDAEGMYYCPYSNNPTSDMCARCEWEHTEREEVNEE